MNFSRWFSWCWSKKRTKEGLRLWTKCDFRELGVFRSPALGTICMSQDTKASISTLVTKLPTAWELRKPKQKPVCLPALCSILYPQGLSSERDFKNSPRPGSSLEPCPKPPQPCSLCFKHAECSDCQLSWLCPYSRAFAYEDGHCLESFLWVHRSPCWKSNASSLWWFEYEWSPWVQIFEGLGPSWWAV